MEHKLQISSCVVCDRLLPLVAKYPWLQVADQPEEHVDQNINGPLSYYPCRNPVLMGRRIRGFFHGWVILSSYPDNVKWLLWNPITLKTIHLPPLVLKDGDSASISGDPCLPFPPGVTGSVLLLNRREQRTFVFCRLDRKRNKLRWTEMTYARQLKSITGRENGFLTSLTCCNGKIYALNVFYRALIQVDIVVKNEELVITLLQFVDTPYGCCIMYLCMEDILKGSTELYYLRVNVCSEAMRRLTDVHLFKLDMTSMIWEKPTDLSNTIFFIDLAHPPWLFYRPTIFSESGGGYIHFFGKSDKLISSYNLKDNTVSLSSMPCLLPRNQVPFWECRAKEEDGGRDYKEVGIVARDDELADTNNTTMFSIPFDVLKMIMELCVGVEYLNFRATCKLCHLAAPVVQWSNERSLMRLQTYSLPSPWLAVLDTDRGVMTFTDPMSGDKYFMKTPQELIGDVQICCSRYGWLFIYNLSHRPFSLMLFNPFTNDLRKLPSMGYMPSICFSAPPTSSHCMVVGLLSKRECAVCVHIVDFLPDWTLSVVDYGETVRRSISFPVLDLYDVYALEAGERLDVYRLREEEDGKFWEVVAEAPRDCPSAAQCFLVKCDEHHLLLVRVEEYGESVEVFKLASKEWEKIDNLGRRMIYVGGATCLCMEAKTPEMENKIYFPRLHSKNGKIVFYSLKTCRYHTFGGSMVEEESFRDFLGTKYILSPHAWIQPSWSL